MKIGSKIIIFRPSIGITISEIRSDNGLKQAGIYFQCLTFMLFQWGEWCIVGGGKGMVYSRREAR